MILVEAWKLVVLERYAKFDGRAGRAEYWWFFLATFIIGIVINVLTAISSAFYILSFIYFIAVLVPSLAVAIRRLHDTNKSGWFLLLALIPIVGFIVLIVFLATPGEPGPNNYGLPDPGPTGRSVPPDAAVARLRPSRSRYVRAHDVCRGSRRVRRRQSCDGTPGLAREVRRRHDTRTVASTRARRRGCAGRSRRGRGRRAGRLRCGGARRRPDRAVARQGVGSGRRLRIHRAQPCPRHTRIRRPARVPDVRRHPVRRQGCRPAVSRLRRVRTGRWRHSVATTIGCSRSRRCRGACRSEPSSVRGERSTRAVRQ